MVAVAGALAFVVVAVLLVPWDPIPGGPLHPPRRRRCSRPSEIQRAEDFTSLARVWSWCLAGGLAAGGLRAGLHPARRPAGRPGARTLVVAGRGRGRRRSALVGRLRHAAVRGRCCGAGCSTTACPTRPGAPTPSTWPRASAVDVVVTSIALVVLVGVARRWPRAWPAVAGLLLAGLVMLGSFVYPLLVEPLFNHFKPLPDGRCAPRSSRWPTEEGVQVDDVLVADASRRTTTLNAYVSGLRLVAPGGRLRQPRRRRRTTARCSPWSPTSSATRATTTCSPARCSVRPARCSASGCWGCWSGARRVADPRRVPRVLALVAVATLLASPVQNGISRRIETRADVDALRATGDPAAFVELQKELARTSLADPTPPAWSQFWFGSHPTTLQRIALAERFAQRSSRRNAVTPGSAGSEGVTGVCAISCRIRPSLVLEDRARSCLGTCRRATTEREDDDGDHGGDAGDQEAVLDGGGTALEAPLPRRDASSPGCGPEPAARARMPSWRRQIELAISCCSAVDAGAR